MALEKLCIQANIQHQPDLELRLVEALLFFEGLGEIPGRAPACGAPPSLTLRRSMSLASALPPAAPDW